MTVGQIAEILNATLVVRNAEYNELYHGHVSHVPKELANKEVTYITTYGDTLVVEIEEV